MVCPQSMWMRSLSMPSPNRVAPSPSSLVIVSIWPDSRLPSVSVVPVAGPGQASRAKNASRDSSGFGYDPSTFARDLRATGLIEAATGDQRPTRGRPAALFSFIHRQPAWGAGRRKRVTG